MDDQGTSGGRHTAHPDGPDGPEPGESDGTSTGAHRVESSSGSDTTGDDGGGSSGDDAATPPEGTATPPEGTATPPEGTATPTRGRIRTQDPETTRPRAPGVAEQRARREAQRRERAQVEAARVAEERKRRTRKRVLIGGGVAVGVVALVAVAYAASQPDEVTAQCVDQNQVVVDDNECEAAQRGGYYDSGGHFVPIFIGGFGRQYHYNYGSSSPRGTVATGGSTAPPVSGASVRSGTSGSSIGDSSGSGTVSRGGLGVGGSGSSSGS